MSLMENNNFIVYSSKYDSQLLRGIDDENTPRPWDLQSEIKNFASAEKIILDIGCGTAFKTIPLSPYFKEIIGLDPSFSMIDAALRNVQMKRIKNLSFIIGKGERIPFFNNSFDMVICMLSRWEPSEIWRVLKQNGVAIIEHIGCEDKKDFKLFFGKDELGWRGQLIEYSRDYYIDLFYKKFSQFFNSVSIKNGFWNTFYSIEGLKQLLSYTPTIRNFNINLDTPNFNKAIKRFSTKEGIKLTQNRILIHVENPKIA